MGVSDQFDVMPVGTVGGQSNRNPLHFRQETALDTPVAPVCRDYTGFFESANGDVLIAPSIDSQDQSIVVFDQPKALGA